MIAEVTLRIELPDDIAARLWNVGEWDFEEFMARYMGAGDSECAEKLRIETVSATQSSPGRTKPSRLGPVDAERRQRRHEGKVW